MTRRAAAPESANAPGVGAFDTGELRRALGAFATGVTILTTCDDNDEPRGFTVNSFTSVSLDPPLVLVCISRHAGSREAFERTRFFAVNILAEDQKNVSTAFASGVRNRFGTVSWRREATGAPILENVASWLDCAVHDRIDAGDHVILIGRVMAFGQSSARPLGYCRGAYISFAAFDQALEPSDDRATLRFGAVVEYEGAILLVPDSQGSGLAPPVARHLGPRERKGTLIHQLDARGIAVKLPFLLAVIDEPSVSSHTIYYRGEATAVTTSSRRNFHTFGAIPWTEIANGKVRSMLQHFVHEREQDAFLL